MSCAATLAMAPRVPAHGHTGAEDLFLRHLLLIEKIAVSACRPNRLPEADVEDFVSWVKLALIENDYAVIRKFEGRSSFSTYLTTVIRRLLSQHRAKEWGRWRPSAEARRLGDLAITLERLTTRDGHSMADAMQILGTGTPPAASRAALESIARRLPLRQPRVKLVAAESSARAVASEDDPTEAVRHHDRRTTARAATQALDRVVAGFRPEDQLLLRQRFWNGQSVADIAQALQLHQKRTYRRFDKLLERLRTELETAGVGRAEVDDLIRSGMHPVSIPSLSGD